MIEADAALQAGFGLRDHAERAEQRIKELEADQGMLKSVHGALVDAGCRMGDIGKCEADLVREVTRQRDEAKERVKELEAEVLLAFVAGAAWWQAEGHGATMFSDERRRAEAEAERRWPGVGWPTHPQRVREAEQRLANLVEAGKSLLSYVKQIELTLYSENDSGMHPVVERFSAALAAAQPEEAAERG